MYIKKWFLQKRNCLLINFQGGKWAIRESIPAHGGHFPVYSGRAEGFCAHIYPARDTNYQ